MFKSLSIMKTIACTVLAAFIYSFVIYEPLLGVTTMMKEEKSVSSMTEKIDRFVLPYRLGRIVAGHDTGSKSLVIHIQDLHCHPEVQRNIADIVKLFDGKYNVDKVFVEGAPSGKVDTGFLSSIPDEKAQKQTLDNLLNKGILSGTEYYSILNKKDNLYGLEEWQVYLSNLKRIRSMMENKEQHLSMADDLNRNIAQLKGEYLSSRVQRLETFLKTSGADRNEKFYLKLEALDKKYNVGLELYPNLSKYITMIKLNKGMKTRKLQGEFKDYVRDLQQVLPYAVYSRLAEKLKDGSRTEEYYLSLSEIAREYSPALETKYPVLAKFFEYIRLNYSINPIHLALEERAFSRNLLSAYSERMLDKEVLFLAEMGEHFRNFLDLKITPDEYDYFVKHVDRFRIVLRKYFDNRELGAAARFMDEQEGFDFFATNIARNQIFCNAITAGVTSGERAAGDRQRQTTGNYSSILQQMDEYENVYIVVTGGFHLHVSDMLKDSGISYLAVTPNTTQGFDETVYERFLTDSFTINEMLESAFAVLFSAVMAHGVTPNTKQAT